MDSSKTDQLAAALFELADVLNSVGGDFHTMHLNFSGIEFDTMHKKVLLKYYEHAADDYDEAAEWALCFGVVAPNPNESAARIQYESFTGGCTIEMMREAVAERINFIIQSAHTLYTIFNEATDCDRSVAIANWLQDLLQYWVKEYYYFNNRRA